jgi:hypothetical protein
VKMLIHSPSRTFTAAPGDWIIRNSRGEVTACPHQAFQRAAALRARAAIAMEARRGATGNTDATAEGGDSAGRQASPKQDRP